MSSSVPRFKADPTIAERLDILLKTKTPLVVGIYQVLRYFGPLNAGQIESKLAMRGFEITPIAVAKELEMECGGVLKLADIPGNHAAGSLFKVYQV